MIGQYFIPTNYNELVNLIFIISEPDKSKDRLHCFIEFDAYPQLMCHKYEDESIDRDEYAPWDEEGILLKFRTGTWMAVGHIWAFPPVYSVCAECQKELYIEDYLCGGCR